MALTVSQLTKKKDRLAGQLAKVRTETEEKIVKMTEAHEARVNATRTGITDRITKLEKEISEVDVELEQQVSTLQAQIDAIRGITKSLENEELEESTEESDDLFDGTEEEELA